MKPRRVAVVVKGYPRLSETFIAQEILALEQRGLAMTIVSLRHPTDRAVHAINRQIRSPVLYLPEYLYQEPLRVLRGWWRARRLPGCRDARRTWLHDLGRDPTPNRGRRFGQACVLAAELPGDVEHIHVHYLHTPCSVARYAARMTELPFSVSAHAKDIWITPEAEIADKIRDAAWTVTCAAANAKRLRAIAPEADIELVHHGLDLARFPAPHREAGPDGSNPDEPVRILCVARAVPKKGLDILLDALAELPPDLHWHLEHVGGGPLLDDLAVRSRELGIADRITWRGALAQDDVLDTYQRADLFVLPSRIGADGDRDGIPNVLMEAMSQELAVVSTRLSGIPELVGHGREGLLVAPEDGQALVAALERLIRDPAQRLELGRNGRRRVAGGFAMETGIDRIARRFGLPRRRDAA